MLTVIWGEMKKLAVIDPSSYSLPYDFGFLSGLCGSCHVDFYCSYGANFSEYEARLNQVSDRVFAYKISPSSTTKLRGLYNYLLMLFSLFLKRNEYDYIHFQWSIFWPAELLFFLLCRKKTILTIHNDIPHNSNRKRSFSLLVLSRLAKLNVFVSGFTKSRFEKRYFRSSKNILIQHGLIRFNISDVNDNLKEEKINLDKFDMIFWGRVERYKGLELFADRLLSAYKIGIYGKWSAELLELKRTLSLESNFHIHDEYLPESSIKHLFCSRAVFVLPYNRATQSGVLYTLLAYEVVFISSNVGENSEFLNAIGLPELTFDVGDVVGLIDAFKFAQENYSSIIAKLRLVKEKYEWTSILNSKVVNSLYK